MSATKDLVIITGTSRGMGLAVADRFVGDGWEVLGIARNGPVPGADGTGRTEDGVRLICADLTQESEIERVATVIAGICQSEGRKIAFLLNNAGEAGHLGPLRDDSIADLTNLMALHVYAPLRLVTAVLDHYRHGARVLNMTSRASSVPLAGMGPYCISKAAEAALTGMLRLELGPRGLLFGSLIPGEVNTGMQADLREPSPTSFALAGFFRQNVVNLIPVAVAARFVYWVLTATTDEDFARTDDWFIYDQPTDPPWLASGERFDYPNPDG